MLPVLVLAGPTEEVCSGGESKLLTGVERRRAAGFVFDRDRRDFIAAHVLVRRCAARVLGSTVSTPTLVQHCAHCGPGHGRPYLAQAPQLGVSLSHTRGYVVVAVGPGRIGVDAQPIPTRPPDPSWTAAFLTPAERAAAGDQAGATRQWVRKEALVKRGELTLERMTEVDLSALPCGPWAAVHRRTAAHRLRWGRRHLLEWQTSSGVAVSVITDAPARTREAGYRRS